jgi:hypothetical protein
MRRITTAPCTATYPRGSRALRTQLVVAAGQSILRLTADAGPAMRRGRRARRPRPRGDSRRGTLVRLVAHTGLSSEREGNALRLRLGVRLLGAAGTRPAVRAPSPSRLACSHDRYVMDCLRQGWRTRLLYRPALVAKAGQRTGPVSIPPDASRPCGERQGACLGFASGPQRRLRLIWAKTATPCVQVTRQRVDVQGRGAVPRAPRRVRWPEVERDAGPRRDGVTAPMANG